MWPGLPHNPHLRAFFVGGAEEMSDLSSGPSSLLLGSAESGTDGFGQVMS